MTIQWQWSNYGGGDIMLKNGANKYGCRWMMLLNGVFSNENMCNTLIWECAISYGNGVRMITVERIVYELSIKQTCHD